MRKKQSRTPSGASLAVAKEGGACMHVPADGYSPRSVRKHAQAGATIKRLQLRLKGGEDGNPGLRHGIRSGSQIRRG